MDREIVKELIQNDFNEKNLASEINLLLPGGWKRDIVISEYRRLAGLLDGRGAGKKVAEDIYHSLLMVNNVN